MPRGLITDANGKRWSKLPAKAERMWEIKAEDYSKPLVQCALEAGSKPSRAEANASTWWNHPTLIERRKRFLEMAERRGLPALIDMVEQSQEDRLFARKHKNPTAAHTATRTTAELSGHLEKDREKVGDTYNFLPGANPLIVAGMTNVEDVRAWYAERKAKLVEGKVDHADRT